MAALVSQLGMPMEARAALINAVRLRWRERLEERILRQGPKVVQEDLSERKKKETDVFEQATWAEHVFLY